MIKYEFKKGDNIEDNDGDEMKCIMLHNIQNDQENMVYKEKCLKQEHIWIYHANVIA